MFKSIPDKKPKSMKNAFSFTICRLLVARRLFNPEKLCNRIENATFDFVHSNLNIRISWTFPGEGFFRQFANSRRTRRVSFLSSLFFDNELPIDLTWSHSLQLTSLPEKRPSQALHRLSHWAGILYVKKRSSSRSLLKRERGWKRRRGGDHCHPLFLLKNQCLTVEMGSDI